MNSVFTEKSACCGCAACRAACPAGAIIMTPDEEGFLYPSIEQDLCLDCGLCLSICPLGDDFQPTGRKAAGRFYAARHKSEEVLLKSTSGGAFTALSDAVLASGGLVYGADFDGRLRVVHGRAETSGQRDRMRISKYVQSDLGSVYGPLSEDLDVGRPVLFTGTPCQAAGVRSFFRDHPGRDNLYVCDLICHSVPSPRIWEDYKEMLAGEAGGKLLKIQFRSKKYAWSRANSNKGLMYWIEGEGEYREDDRYYELFIMKNLICRPSCHQCRFTRVERSSDITIADYFGIELFTPDWYSPLGVSLIIVSSAQGEKILRLAGEELLLEERPAAEAVSQQKRLSAPGAKPLLRDEFWRHYLEHGLAASIKFARDH